MMDKLIVRAYGKVLSPELKRHSQIYISKIKDHGRAQFLDRGSDFNLSSKLPHKIIFNNHFLKTNSNIFNGPQNANFNNNNTIGSGVISARKDSKGLKQQSHRRKDEEGSADKDNSFQFRRFGKNQKQYRQIIQRMIQLFETVKHISHSLHELYLSFIRLKYGEEGAPVEREGWFLFKSMVYKDLMMVLFKSNKIEEFLTHLRKTFKKNKFYVSRFKTLEKKLKIIESHLAFLSNQKVSIKEAVQDELNIRERVKKLKERRIRRHKTRNDQLEVKEYYNKLVRPSVAFSDFVYDNLMIDSFFYHQINREMEFSQEISKVNKEIMSCLDKDHRMVVLGREDKLFTNEELRRLITQNDQRISSYQRKKKDLKEQEKIREEIHCLECCSILDFWNFLIKKEPANKTLNNLQLPTTSNNIFVRVSPSQRSSKQLDFPNPSMNFLIEKSRVSNPYSFKKSELHQDKLYPRINAERSIKLEIQKVIPTHLANSRKIKMAKKRERQRKRRVQTSLSKPEINKIELSPCKKKVFKEDLNPEEIVRQFLERDALRNPGRKYLNPKMLLSSKKVMKSLDFSTRVEPEISPKTKARNLKRKQMTTTQIINLERKEEIQKWMESSVSIQLKWKDLNKKLTEKRQRKEKSRKKGQRKNRRTRLNEELRSVKEFNESRAQLDDWGNQPLPSGRLAVRTVWGGLL